VSDVPAPPNSSVRGSTVGERVRELRLRAGLSQNDVAGDRLSASYVSRIEAGQREPGPEVTTFLAEQLGCDPSVLATGQPSERRIRLELELEYARLVRRHGEPVTAEKRLAPLVDAPDIEPDLREQIAYERGLTYEALGDLDAAIDCFLPLLDSCIAGTSQHPLDDVAVSLCRCYLDAGDARAAIRVGDRSLDALEGRALAGTDGYLQLAATVLAAQFQDGELEAAAARARELIQLAERTGGPSGQAALLWNAAVIADARNDLTEAIRLSRRALGLLSEQGNTRDLPRLQYTVAGFLISAGADQAAAASALLDTAWTTLRDLGSTIDLGGWALERARTDLALGHPDTARDAARDALTHLGRSPLPETVRAHIVLGDCLTVLGHSSQAVAEYTAAAEVLKELRPTRLLAPLWRDLGDRYATSELLPAMLEAYRNALDLAGIRVNSPLRGLMDRAAAPPLPGVPPPVDRPAAGVPENLENAGSPLPTERFSTSPATSLP
jgi:tetratricopeptide (TPR) repeat protein